MVSVVLVMAFAGLYLVNVSRVTAERNQDGQLVQAGARTSESNPVIPLAGSSPVGPLIKMLSALVIVIFCVYIGLYLLKRLMVNRYAANGHKHLLQVIQTTYVGPKKSVALVRVADRSVLIGVTDSQISVLAQLDVNETGAILENETETGEKRDFGMILSAAAKKVRRLSLKRNPAALEG